MPPLKEPKQRRRRGVMRTHRGIISKLLNGNPPPVAVLILVLGFLLWVVGTVILRGIESSSSSTSISGHLRGGNGMVWVHSDSQPFVSRVSLSCTELCLLLSFSIYFVLFNMCSCYNISYKNDTTHMFPE